MTAEQTTDDPLTCYISERRALISLAQSVVGSTHIAEELVQDSWLRWTSKSYAKEHARPTLMRIVKNLAIDWHRRRRVEFEAIEAQRLMQEDAPDSERMLIGKQRLELVIAALQTLPPRTLMAFRFSRIDNLTLREIGTRLGVSESRACQLVADAMVCIVAALEKGA